MSSRITNIGVVSKIENRISNIEGNVAMHQIQLVVAVREAVMAELQQLLGPKMKHFGIDMEGDGLAMRVKIKILDDQGKFIYYGTKPHNISSSRPMPVGNDRFAYDVRNPGTPGMAEEIKVAIGRGVNAGRMSVGGAVV